MKISLYHNHYNEQHLEEVKQEMIKLGAPSIRAIWSECYGMWMAVEGCHRLRAAKELGIMPIIIDISAKRQATIQDDGENKKRSVKQLTAELEESCWKRQYISFDL